MNAEKGFTKAIRSRAMCRVLSILLVAVLSFSLLCGLTGCQKNDPVPQESTQATTEATRPKETQPAGTEPVETEPTEPKPTEPKPTEPKPTEPKPTEPKPTEPKPTEPKPTEPKPTEPKPTEPKPTEPKPTEPKPTEPTVYTVTFQDWDGKVLKTEQVEKGKAATAPANPTREGYTFEGWDKTFDNVTADMEVTATYKAVETKPTDPQVKTYTVTFKDHDGKVLKTQNVESGKSATAPANPTRTHYTFTGWDKAFNNITSDLVVTATYKINEYTVTFKDYDGTVLKTQKVESGKAATAPANPSREGYTFEGWDKAFNNITSDLVVTATYKEIPPAVVTYTVTFKDHDGTVLKTETVEKGKAATAPANPSREHFTFAGWDKSFNNVTSDLVVTATYTTSKIVISAESITVNKGTGEVTVNIRVYNNPGIMGAVLKVSVNDQMFSFKSGSKAGFPGLTLTSPGSGVTSSPYTFMLDALELSGEDRKDGTLFSITFTIDNPNATGTYDVKLSYNNKGIFDENYNYPNVALENGTITIK